MPLSDAEKEKIKYHLGYVGTSTGSMLQLGIARTNQFFFLIDNALQYVKESMIPKVRSIVCTMDGLEAKMEAAACTFMVEAIGDIKMRGAGCDSTTEMFEREYVRWGYRLADIIGAPPYPYSARYVAHPPMSMACGGQVRNLKVR